MGLNPKVVAAGEGTRLQILAETGFDQASRGPIRGAVCDLGRADATGAGPPVHEHSREEETFYVLEGTYEFIVGGQVVAAHKGTTVLGSRGIPHSFSSIGASEGARADLCAPAGIERFFEEMTGMLAAGVPDLAKLRELASRYGVELQGQAPWARMNRLCS